MLSPIDPFGFWPAQRSAIAGLGGKEKPTDRSYVFHSPYVSVEPGRITVEVEFAGLEARSGMLLIRIYQNLSGTVTERTRTTTLLPPLAVSTRPIRLPFLADAGADYAVLGHIIGDTDARATAVQVRIGRSLTDAIDPEQHRSQFGRNQARLQTRLSSDGTPSLAYPVSQGFTPCQLQGETFAKWDTQLSGDAPDVARWEAAYILQALEVYGRLTTGARGLGFGAPNDPVAAIAMRSGCVVTAAPLSPGETMEHALDRLSNDETAFGFDFLWSRSGALDGLRSAQILERIDSAFEHLKPGGLAILLLAVTPDQPSGATIGLDANAIQRVAIGMIASGHIVAQLRIMPLIGPSGAAQPFGLIVRKSTDQVNA